MSGKKLIKQCIAEDICLVKAYHMALIVFFFFSNSLQTHIISLFKQPILRINMPIGFYVLQMLILFQL
jgi:hypothetical protein